MLNVGLTGNIGSGKSTVARIFSVLGVPVYPADAESKKFLGDPGVAADIAAQFGQQILSESGLINRRTLASLVFRDPKALSALNSILHPLVRNDARNWTARHAHHPYVIHEAAVIFESGFKNEYDRIICVTCPAETAVRRVMKRDGASEEEILGRLRYQMDEAEKARLSDYVVRNDGSEFLTPQVLAIHRILTTAGSTP